MSSVDLMVGLLSVSGLLLLLSLGAACKVNLQLCSYVLTTTFSSNYRDDVASSLTLLLVKPSLLTSSKLFYVFLLQDKSDI